MRGFTAIQIFRGPIIWAQSTEGWPTSLPTIYFPARAYKSPMLSQRGTIKSALAHASMINSTTWHVIVRETHTVIWRSRTGYPRLKGRYSRGTTRAQLESWYPSISSGYNRRWL